MIQLELQPEVEALIVSEAANRPMSVEAYVEQAMASYVEEEAGLREGLADIEAGRTRPARPVFAELHQPHGIQG